MITGRTKMMCASMALMTLLGRNAGVNANKTKVQEDTPPAVTVQAPTCANNTRRVNARVVGNVFNGTASYKYTYDSEGRVATKTEMEYGQVTSYTYDEWGNIQTSTVGNKVMTYTHELNSDHKPISSVARVTGDYMVDDYDIHIEYEYGADYQLMGKTYSYTYTYLNAEGKETSVDVIELRVYTYNEDGKMATMYAGYESTIGDYTYVNNSSYIYDYTKGE